MVLHYYFNYTYYVEVLCENKDKPEMHCNGTCALGKELKLAEHAKQQAETNIPELAKIEISQFLVETINTEQTFCFSETITKRRFQNDLLPECLFGIGVFHPPTC